MDSAIPSVTLKLGGRELALRFNVRTCRLIREHTGFDVLASTLDDVPAPITKVLTEAKLPRLLWAAMQNKENEPHPAYEWVEEALDYSDMESLIKPLLDAWPKWPTAKASSNGSNGNPPTEASEVQLIGSASGQAQSSN